MSLVQSRDVKQYDMLVGAEQGHKAEPNRIIIEETSDLMVGDVDSPDDDDDGDDDGGGGNDDDDDDDDDGWCCVAGRSQRAVT